MVILDILFFRSSEIPQKIESLEGKQVIQIACGSSHSAAITSKGELFTWGKGRYGRLGHGNGDDCLKPKLVEALKNYKVIDVACGSGDAQVNYIQDVVSLILLIKFICAYVIIFIVILDFGNN